MFKSLTFRQDRNKIFKSSMPEQNIELLDDPEYVVIPLEYPGRILYKPTVKIGDQVYKNQIIGRSPLGHCIHASISGVVRDILAIWSATIFHVPAILIQRNNEKACSVSEIFDQWGTSSEKASTMEKLKILGVISPWNRPGRSQKEIDERFPDIKKIVIKGIDEEPTIFVNDLIIKNYPEKVIRGISLLKNLAPGAEMTLAISDYLPDQQVEKYHPHIQLSRISGNYRDRISQLMVAHLTGVKIPTISAYRTHGIAVISAEYLLSMLDALDGMGPFIHKYMTIVSSKNTGHRTVKFPIGMTIRQILKALHLDKQEFSRIIVDGPMQGITQYTDLTPLTKTSDGLYLMQEKVPADTANLTCQNCGRCTRICPHHLQVHLINRYAEYDLFKETVRFHPEACMDCGLCAYVCPARRPLVQLINLCKKYCGMTDEFAQQQAECGASSALERWELSIQNPAVLDTRPVTSNS